MAQALCPPRPGHAPGALASCFSRLNETQRRLGLAGRALVWRPRSIPWVRTASAPCPRSAPAAPTLSLAGHPESEPVAPLLNALASDLQTQTRRASSGSAGRLDAASPRPSRAVPPRTLPPPPRLLCTLLCSCLSFPSQPTPTLLRDVSPGLPGRASTPAGRSQPGAALVGLLPNGNQGVTGYLSVWPLDACLSSPVNRRLWRAEAMTSACLFILPSYSRDVALYTVNTR